MTVTPSQPRGFASSPSLGRLAGEASRFPGSFFHRSSRVRQDLRDQRVQPLHLSVPPCPPKGARHEARQHAVYLIAKHTKLSFPQIGRILGGRDHTTILYSLQVMNQRRGDNVRGSGPIPVSKILGWQRYKDSVRARRAA